jgi:hypothetical protein
LWTVHLFNRQEEKKKHKCLYCNNDQAYKYCECYLSLMTYRYSE